MISACATHAKWVSCVNRSFYRVICDRFVEMSTILLMARNNSPSTANWHLWHMHWCTNTNSETTDQQGHEMTLAVYRQAHKHSFTHWHCPWHINPIVLFHTHTHKLPHIPVRTGPDTHSQSPFVHCQQTSSLRHVNLVEAIWDLYATLLIFTISSACTSVTPVWGVEFLIYLTFVRKTSSVILLLASCAAEGNPDISDICFGSRGNCWKEFFFSSCMNWMQCELVKKEKTACI